MDQNPKTLKFLEGNRRCSSYIEVSKNSFYWTVTPQELTPSIIRWIQENKMYLCNKKNSRQNKWPTELEWNLYQLQPRQGANTQRLQKLDDIK